MNNKVGDFIINSVLTVLLVGILVLPVASVGLMGVDNKGDVLSGSVSNASSNTQVGDTDSPNSLRQ